MALSYKRVFTFTKKKCNSNTSNMRNQQPINAMINVSDLNISVTKSSVNYKKEVLCIIPTDPIVHKKKTLA